MKQDPLGTLMAFETSSQTAKFYSLRQLEAQGLGALSRLPVSIRILLESVLRNRDGERIAEENVQRLARWQPDAKRTGEQSYLS